MIQIISGNMSYIKFTEIIIRHKDPRDYRKYSLILHYTHIDRLS